MHRFELSSIRREKYITFFQLKNLNTTLTYYVFTLVDEEICDDYWFFIHDA